MQTVDAINWPVVFRTEPDSQDVEEMDVDVALVVYLDKDQRLNVAKQAGSLP